jgi:hypothetical protein
MKSFAFCFKIGCPNAIAEISASEKVESSFMNGVKFYELFGRKANILAKGFKTHFVINCAAINRKQSNP